MRRWLLRAVILAAASLLLLSVGRSERTAGTERIDPAEVPMAKTYPESTRFATFGGGCFWCTEAVFETMAGVIDVVSGYAGGTAANPTYEQVSTGRTGHAEVIRIAYDPQTVTYEALLDMFWRAHDPTTLNRQGADVGTQYRSIILYHDEEQRAAAEKSMAQVREEFSDPIVTQIEPLEEFYPAEEYHQDYYEKNPYAGYCTVVIRPKLKKLGIE